MRNFIQGIVENSKSLLFMTLVLTVLGYISITSMNQSVFPDVRFPRAIIKVHYGYAPLQGMETQAVLPIERVVAATPGVLHYSSKIRRGSAEISIQFDTNSDFKSAFQQITAKVSAISVTAGPKMKIKSQLLNTSSYSVLGYSLASASADYETLRAIVENKIKPALLAVNGVSQVEIIGGVDPQYRIELKPEKLAQFHITPAQISQQLAAANSTHFLGTIVEYGQLVMGFSHTPLNSLYSIENIPIRSASRSIPLKQIADVYLSTTKRVRLTTTDRQKSVLFNVAKTQAADVIGVTREVSRKLAQISATLPPSVSVKRWYALADFIDTSINHVLNNIYKGVAIIALCIFFYLRSIPASLPIIISMIASILISFIFIKLMGYSLNIMTLAGVSASVGILVDMSTVIVENIYRHYQTDKDPAAAVTTGTSEVMSPLIFSTLTTIAVFAPLGLLTGVSGFLFKASSVVIVTTLLVSLVVSFVLAPVLSEYLLTRRQQQPHHENPHRLLNFYKQSLARLLRHSGLVVVATIVLLVSASWSARYISTSYLPVWDEGTFIMDLDTPAGTSLAEMSRIIDGVEAVIARTPEIQTYSRIIGDSAIRPNEAHFFMHPRANSASGSAASVFAVMDKLESSLIASNPDLNIDLHQILPDRFDNFSGKQKSLIVEVTGASLDAVSNAVGLLESAFKKLKQVEKVKLKKPEYQKEFQLEINDAKLVLAGLSRQQLIDQVNLALEGVDVNTLNKGAQKIKLRITYPAKWQNFRPVIEDLPVFKNDGSSLPLGSLARVKLRKSPDILYRQDGALILRMNIKMKGSNLDANARLLNTAIDQTALSSGIRVHLAGDWKAQIKSFNELKNVLYSAIFLVFTLLLIAFRSYGYAMLIMINTTISMSFIVFGLLLTHTMFNVSTFMGLIAAIGIVVNNAILIINFLQVKLRQGLDPQSSIIEACSLRVRPILITSTTTILGFLPMALSGGRGGEMLQPFAITIIFGILGTVFSSLIVLPNIYGLKNRLAKQFFLTAQTELPK